MQKKIIFATILYVIVVSTSLGIVSSIIVNNSIDRSLKNRLLLASTIAKKVDFILQNNLSRLYDISLSGRVNLKDNDWEPEKRALENAYQYSLFTEGVFLLDKHGNTLLSYPARYERSYNLMFIPWVSQVILEGRPTISNLYTIEPIKKPLIFAMVPLKNNAGDVIGIAGGIINPTNPLINQLLQTSEIGLNSYIEIIDSNEVVIASNNTSHVLEHHNHDGIMGRMIKDKKTGILKCSHGFSQEKPNPKKPDVLTFVPLEIAQWGVILGQLEEDVYAPSRKLQTQFLLLATFFILTGIVFAIGMSRSIVRPVSSLIGAANRIAGGDLSKPVGDFGMDEILELSKSFEIMRSKLAESLENIQKQNIELESRVMKRTMEIWQSQQKVESLLKMVISSQEDERKRIARDLHDETMQTLSALLMKIDMCKLYPENISLEKMEEMRGILLNSLDGIHNIIQNLRPAVLDDLGLEAAIRWLLDKHLKDKGITCFFNAIGTIERRLNSMIETTLFRIIQESIINIAKHSKAENGFVILKYQKDALAVTIEDDGEGFDVPSVLRQTDGVRGLGVLGIRERVNLLDGRFELCSTPNEGTRIDILIPLKSYSYV